MIYFPSPTLERAVARAASWLKGKSGKSRIEPGTAASGELQFALRYAAIKPPPPTAGVAHD